MTAALRVLSPGPACTIQDGGRFGLRQSGVPTSGPLDRIAFRLANALVGNETNAPALELLMLGGAFEVLAPVRIAVLGGVQEFSVITNEGEQRVAAGRSIRLEQGAQIKIGALSSLCAYLAIEGGFDVPDVLGSASTYLRSAFGGMDGRTLRKGDVLAAPVEAAPRTERALAENFNDGFDAPVRVVLGPQDDYFTTAAIETFLNETYKVTPQSDRMGFRLEGAKLQHVQDNNKGYNIVSDGIVPGSIQVPGDGQPIVLMADSQTAGGYPKIATVASADLPLLARRKPGRSVRFVAISQTEAEEARRTQEMQLAATITSFKEVADDVALNLEALANANLIGGIVSAED